MPHNLQKRNILPKRSIVPTTSSSVISLIPIANIELEELYTNTAFDIMHESENTQIAYNLYDEWFWYLKDHINSWSVEPYQIILFVHTWVEERIMIKIWKYGNFCVVTLVNLI